MISAHALLLDLRPMHVCISPTGHMVQVGKSLSRLGVGDIEGRRFLEIFELQGAARPSDMSALRRMTGRVIRLRLRDVPDLSLRGLLIDDTADGLILDLSFGISVVAASLRFGLTARDFAPCDLAVELLFLHEAKSTAMAASFSLNARLNGARLAAETEAVTDGLTALHNRRALDATLSRLGQSDTDYAILHMDLDRFKQVNDSLGHAIGDAVLKRVATILRTHTRKDDLLVRTGGDEFLILCPGLTETARLTDLSVTLIREVSQSVPIAGHKVAIGASIGIATSRSMARADPGTLVERADVALYAAKRAGRGQPVFWQPDMGQTLAELDRFWTTSTNHVALQTMSDARKNPVRSGIGQDIRE